MRVVYDSFGGRYSDNPRAIYEALLAAGDGHEHVWVCDPAHLHGFPAGLSTVPVGTAQSIEALERADMVVANTHIQVPWTKRPGARYLQTWHGTPLKKVHRDILQPPAERLGQLDMDVARWDVLLSPNAAATASLRQAFRYGGEVYEAGYPRNDALLSPDRDAVRAKVRAGLGISEDQIAVLYTPTYRDNVTNGVWRADVSPSLDVAAVTDGLGPDYVLLVRPHYFVSDQVGPPSSPGTRDVARYPDVAELYLAADAMVTDYSSTMFDFAVTGKPLLFYAYDLEYYRDELRGFYFDIGVDPPGPIARSEDELVAALSALERTDSCYRQAYERFRATYSYLEDGHATERVIARYFATG